MITNVFNPNMPTLRVRSLSRLDQVVGVGGFLYLLTSWTGITLAELGRFSGAGTIIGAALLGSTVIVVVRGFPKNPDPYSDPTRASRSLLRVGLRSLLSLSELLAILAILSVAVFLYFRPSEAIFATHDAGARINAAAHIAQTGSIPIHDPNLPTAVFTGNFTTTLGLYAVDPVHGTLLPQFSGVTEIWEALALTTLAPPGSLVAGYQSAPVSFPERPFYLPALFAVLALLTLYAGLRRSFGVPVAVAAVTALAFSYPEITYARLVMAEIPTQLACAIALYGLICFWQDGSARCAALAGAAVGIAFLTHIDAFLLYLPVSLWALWLIVSKKMRRAHLLFFGFAFALFLQSAYHYIVFEYPYVNVNFETFLLAYQRLTIAAAAGVIFAAAGLVSISRDRDGVLSRIMGSRRLRVSVAVFIVGIALYGYFVRPVLAPAQITPAHGFDSPSATISGVTLVLLGEYISPLTLALSLAGVTWMVVGTSPPTAKAMLWTGGLYTLIFCWNPLVSPPQPFWVRRYVPEAIPFLFISAAIGSVVVARLLKRDYMRRTLLLVLLGGLLVSTAAIGFPLWLIGPEFRGGIAETGAFARSLPENSVVLFDRSAAASWLPLPLTFLFHRDAFVPTDQGLDSTRVSQAIATWRKQGKRVIFVTSGGETSLSPQQWAFRPLAQQRFRFTAFPLEFLRPPTAYDWVDFHVAAYDVIPATEEPMVTFPFILHLGEFDYGYLMSGFGPNNYSGQTSYRYTASDAAVDLPRPPTKYARVTVHMAGYRPPDAPPADLKLSLDGRPLREIRFPSGGDPSMAFQDYTFEADAGGGSGNAPLRLEFQTSTWRPSDYGYGDQEQIGIAVMWIRVDGI